MQKSALGIWEEISPDLKYAKKAQGSPVVRTLEGHICSSVDRASRFREYLMQVLWSDDDPEGLLIPEWMRSIRLRAHDMMAEDQPWTPEELKAAFLALSNGKCSLPSRVAYEMLKQAYRTPPGRERLEALLQACFRDTDVPAEFDLMFAAPGWKSKGSPLDMERYRLLGLLEPLGKVLDRLVADRIARLIDPLLRPSFVGFRQKHGAPEGIAFLRRLHEIYNYLLEHDFPIISLDLKQAFDRFKRAAIRFAVRHVWGFSWKLRDLLIRMLYARVRVLGTKGAPSSAPFELKAGGKTGAPSTPVVFSW